MATKRVFYFEHTDLFGGECNYCFLNRFAVMATTERGAVSVLSRHIGLSHRFDGCKYVSRSGATAFYLVDFAFEGREDFHFERFADYEPVNFERGEYIHQYIDELLEGFPAAPEQKCYVL